MVGFLLLLSYTVDTFGDFDGLMFDIDDVQGVQVCPSVQRSDDADNDNIKLIITLTADNIR